MTVLPVCVPCILVSVCVCIYPRSIPFVFGKGIGPPLPSVSPQTNSWKAVAIALQRVLVMQGDIPDEHPLGVLVRRRVIGHICVGQLGRLAAR